MLWTGIFIGLAFGVIVGVPLVYLELKRQTSRARLAERRARDAERLAEIGAMTGGLAHEIKNPLSTIGLNAQLLSETIADSPLDEYEKGRLMRRIDGLRREVERLRDILGDFLRFAGSLRLEPHRADLNEIVEELADFYMAQAQHKGVTLRFEPHGQPMPADVDARHLKQALLNLMLNATQAMEVDADTARDGRPRELILRTAPGPRLRDSARSPTWAIHVIDTGPGIPPDSLPRIFTPYFTTRSGGTGLGLPTTRRIVEEHGGAIDVVSEPGRGADFVITLPRAPDNGPVAARPTRP